MCAVHSAQAAAHAQRCWREAEPPSQYVSQGQPASPAIAPSPPAARAQSASAQAVTASPEVAALSASA